MTRTANRRRASAGAALGALILAAAAAAGGAEAQDRPVSYEITNGASIDAPLGGAVGEAARGVRIAVDPERGGCLQCHRIGDAGAGDAPALDGIGAGREIGALRLLIAAPRALDPAAEMPGYYEIGLYGEAEEGRIGRTRLTAAEIEDVLAWLSDPRAPSMAEAAQAALIADTAPASAVEAAPEPEPERITEDPRD